MFQIFFYSHTLDQADRLSLAESLIINCTFCFRAFCFFAAAWLLCRLVCGKGTHATLAGGTRTYAAIGIPFPRRIARFNGVSGAALGRVWFVSLALLQAV